MERFTPAARHIGMVPRQAGRGLVAAAAWGLLGVALAGCGSAVASSGAPGTAGSTAAAAPASATAANLVGCASVSQATVVTVSRIIRLALPEPDGPLMVTDRTPALVHALFRDFCNAVSHPGAGPGAMRCPADFGTVYAGAFYDGNRVLARYTYVAGGCGRVGITVGSTTRSTILAGKAAAAAPHLAADFGAVMESAKPGVMPSPSQVSPGGPDQSA
jgi:hypothetical protein